jgi:hypothetical protein
MLQGFLDWLKALLKGSEIDVGKRIANVHLPGLTIKDIPLSRMVALSKDRRLVAKVLSECFVKRRVMWQWYGAQGTIEECKPSLEEVNKKIGAEIKRLRPSKREQDILLSQFLLAWQNWVVLALKEMRTVVNKHTKGEFAEAQEDLIELLKKLRMNTIPIIRAVSDFLPEHDPIKSQTLDKLQMAQRELEDCHGILEKDIPKVTAEELPGRVFS